MSEPIRAGDMMVVVRGHICDLGLVYRVAELNHFYSGQWQCPSCKECGMSAELVAIRKDDEGSPLSWLRRIPPLSELESSEREKELEHGL